MEARGSMPIGNGRLGATIFGGAQEVFNINEDSIWSGPIQDRTPPRALAALPIAREMLLAGNMTSGREFIYREMNHPDKSQRAYSYFGVLSIDFGHDKSDMENYVRWLDTREGISGVEYDINGIHYTDWEGQARQTNEALPSREYIASYPAGILTGRFTASEPGALGLNATFTRSAGILNNTATTINGQNYLTLQGSSGQPASQNPILFTGQASFVSKDGTFDSDSSTLSVTGATTIEFFFDAETNYRYSSEAEIEAEVNRKLRNALCKGYSKIKKEAVDDATSLLDRASVDLGKSPDGLANLPTDERLLKARNNFNDVELATLGWNYGRHLLVASSRGTDAVDMPANLIGIWNNKTSAAWGGKYTININTEMNYWPAGQTNLIETQEPLFDLIKVAQPRGQKLAEDMYGCDGTVFHHNLDLWGDPATTDNYTSSSLWPMGAAWLSQHMIDHYLFTGDEKFLADTAFPFLADVAKFYECYTFEWKGYKITGPSLSPENSFVVPAGWDVAGSNEAVDIGVAMDDQLMYDVVTSLLEAADVLDLPETHPDVKAALEFLPLIRPPQIGSLGQILEWKQEYTEKAKGHKHLSPLYALHPGSQFAPLKNATLSKAAEVLLDRRRAGGAGGTGWSRTWMINQYTRLFRGADAWEQVKLWFAKFPTQGMWNTDNGAGFQIDGNFGFTSGITEMILQSHAGVIHILPALPASAVPDGNARGLLARGAFEVDITWKSGNLEQAVVTPKKGGVLKLRVANGVPVLVNGNEYNGELEATKGHSYTITLA
ncbi:glycoside hydrolase family 95 protein [Paramyrothecium foliicola]|nr:glycoside hydrolase family 95 protein [Paramyrothecium foliicola]